MYRKLILLFIISMAISFNYHAFARQQAFRVLNYNVLHGFSGDSVIKKKYIEWVKQVNPDIVAYQEMNGYKQHSLEELAAQYGHPYAVMSKEFGHPVAITSKYPIVHVQKVLDNMWHGYIYASINGIHFFVTHLSPFDRVSRQNDIRMVLAHARLLPQKEPMIIAGDMNALSRVDAEAYDTVLLHSMRRIEGRLEPKSGTPIVGGKIIYRHNMDNGNFDYSVTGLVAEAGFTDVFYSLNKKFKHSVPTKGHAKAGSKLRRIDYVWVNPVLAGKAAKAEIIHDDQTAIISDHYPVLVSFNLK